MRNITIEYNNRLQIISGIGIAAAASPIDEPMCANVEKHNGRYKICFVYIHSLENMRNIKLRGVSIEYGERSGRILMYNELLTNENVPTQTECLAALQGSENSASLRVKTNLRSSISAIARIKDACR